MKLVIKTTAYICFMLVLLTSCKSGSSSGTNSTASMEIATNTPIIGHGITTQVIVTNKSTLPLINPSVTLSPWLESIVINKNLTYQGNLNYLESYTFSFYIESNVDTESILRKNYQYIITNGVLPKYATNKTESVLQVIADNLPPVNPTLDAKVNKSLISIAYFSDILINADYWTESPEILGASLGFSHIIGVESGESNVRNAGGTWESNVPDGSKYRAYTSAPPPDGVEIKYGYPTYLADAIPVNFSFPVLCSSIDRKHFAITLNTGEVVYPFVAAISPNDEYNERNTIVMFGSFANRIPPNESNSLYPVKITIIGDLKLMGPNGIVSAKGLSKNITNSYINGNGPQLLNAKLSLMSDAGDIGFVDPIYNEFYPNNGITLFGINNAQYRLRLNTDQGFSPDGVTSLHPNQYESYFRIVVTYNGLESYLTNTGVTYNFPGYGNIEVLGLADLGEHKIHYDSGYIEDHDNQIDIILKGDAPAIRLISAVEVPSSGDYKAAYNPGGPGNNPTAGVLYTAPTVYMKKSVTQALDNPMTVNFPP